MSGNDAPMMFTFEHTHQLTQADYVEIWGQLDPVPRARWVRRIAFVGIGVASLFSTYTMLLGVILLGVIAVSACTAAAARNGSAKLP